MDKLRAMETFVRIVDAGSLTAAAGALGVSLTAVVRTLAGLEARLGLRLLNRTTRRMALTDEGRDYYALCRRILTDLDEGEGALSHRRLEPSGTLRLTAPVMFGTRHVAPAVADFLDAHPAMRVEMLLLDRVTDLLEEGMDVAVRIGPLADSSLVAVTLGHTPRVVCASPGYLARHGRPATPADLARHRCVRFTGLSADPDWEFRAEGRTVRVPVAGVLSTNQIDGAIDACRRGLGCGMFLGYQVAEALAAGELVRILTEYETPPRPVSLLYPHARLLSPRIRAFVDCAVPRLKRCLGERM